MTSRKYRTLGSGLKAEAALQRLSKIKTLTFDDFLMAHDGHRNAAASHYDAYVQGVYLIKAPEPKTAKPSKLPHKLTYARALLRQLVQPV